MRVDRVFHILVPVIRQLKTINVRSIVKHSKIVDEIFALGEDVSSIVTESRLFNRINSHALTW